jgi:histidine ammonia-lyase
MKASYTIGQHSIDQGIIRNIIKNGLMLELDSSIRALIQNSREQLLQILKNSDLPVYGINTGFGALCNTVIPDDQLNTLQSNLVQSHACGFGELNTPEMSRLVLLLKILSLSKGFSAISIELLDFLIQLYNAQIYPVIPKMGSLGASGDLAPLAHLSLSCIGEGQVYYNNTIHETKTILDQKQIKAPSLKAKEGLALLNGTQYSLALLIQSYWTADACFKNVNMIAALSMESFNCNISFLNPKIHEIRNQSGQIIAAADLRTWFEGSDNENRDHKSVQDPYSFRCAPQVHGASKDAIDYCEKIINNEINSVTDNPLLISKDEIISGGNFHAQPLALASDFLCIALSELANISERRLYQLICGQRGLPDFLTSEPGLNSGYMIVQYAAAAAVSMNKQLSTPSSVDSIISSKGQEDHVSMAANAGVKCRMVADQTELVLAMEWMTASRAWQFRKGWKLNSKLSDTWNDYNKEITYKQDDHIPSADYQATISFLRNKLKI